LSELAEGVVCTLIDAATSAFGDLRKGSLFFAVQIYASGHESVPWASAVALGGIADVHSNQSPFSRFQALTCKLSARVFRGGVPVDAKVLGNGIGCLAFGSPLGNRTSTPSFGRPILMPLALARAIPAFVRSLTLWASTFAKEESRASRILRTSSLSVARWGSV
jgi:hypothetical protein